MKKIELTQGQFAIVDDDDYEYLSQWKWHAHYDRHTNSFRARKNIRNEKKATTISMHTMIMKTPKGLVCDHINGDTLDNRKENLRNITNNQNLMNRKGDRGRELYKGVYIQRYKNKKYFVVHVKSTYAGIYETEKEAALAYDKKARELFGEFARLNFPEGEK